MKSPNSENIAYAIEDLEQALERLSALERDGFKCLPSDVNYLRRRIVAAIDVLENGY